VSVQKSPCVPAKIIDQPDRGAAGLAQEFSEAGAVDDRGEEASEASKASSTR
jgi:hypothetical protein